MSPILIGHRGAPTQAPENSLASLALALRQGADGIECDVQLTSDGQAVLLHDETLDATTTGKGALKDHSLAEVRALRLRAQRGSHTITAELVPTLAEVLEAFGHGPQLLNVEIKASRTAKLAQIVGTMILAHGCAETVLVSSFDAQVLRVLAEQFPAVRRALLYPSSAMTGLFAGAWGGYGWITGANALGCEAIHPHRRLVHAGLVERAHALALNVNVWTVDDPPMAQQLRQAGVDGVITNEPAALRAAWQQVAIS